MDIDFSQTGQSFAQNPVVAREELNAERSINAEPVAVPASREAEESSQENATSADEQSKQGSRQPSIESAVQEISDFVQSRNRQLAFSVDQDSKRQVVQVTDSDSGEVIRQIPSEEVLALSERIKELQADVGSAVGVFFNRQA